MKALRRSILCILLVGSWIVAAPGHAANVLCPTAPNDGTATDNFPGLFDPASGAPVSSRMAQVVSDLKSRGLSSGTIVDRLVGAYCPAIAAQSDLSDDQKTNLVRRFARQAISYVYSGTPSGETSVIIDVTLSPDLLDQVEDAAKAGKMNRDAWITAAIVKALSPK